MRDALEPIAMAHVHADEARREYEALGLERFAGYVLGRAGTLGTPPPPVVVAAFGAFAPGMLGEVHETARATASVPDVLAARERAATRALHRALGDPGPEVDETVAALRPGVEAAELLGKPLFAGLRALDWPDDPWARLWHAANLLRELRGDAHVDALVAAAIGPLASNLLTEAHVGLAGRDYTRTRGWSEAEIDAAVADLADRGLLAADGAVTDRGRALRDDVEKATEAALDDVVVAVDEALDTVVERCTSWSAAIVAAGAFPDDAFKRAAG
ncbi:hypothetical protein ACFPK1_14425 [Actinomycetospora rhizophila]|uniref:SalK n=1 Tax=Actinomycetospora rhizophila TaxID=1416876 RepID=A0ABV9ZE95_9PSEU